MISTNTVKRKEDKSFAQFLREEVDEKGELTGNIISSIPKHVITTSQKKFKERPAPVLPHRFPEVRKVNRAKPEKAFIQTSDIRDMQENERRKSLMVKQKELTKVKIEGNKAVIGNTIIGQISAPVKKRAGRPKKEK